MEKAPTRPRTEEHLFAPDDDVLEAYLEAGHNYGLAARGDVAYIDADEPDALADLVEELPATARQVSGSRTSEHYFLRVPGLDEDVPLEDLAVVASLHDPAVRGGDARPAVGEAPEVGVALVPGVSVRP